MEKVLARRDVNRQTLEQYILDETETFEILGPGRDAAPPDRSASSRGTCATACTCAAPSGSTASRSARNARKEYEDAGSSTNASGRSGRTPRRPARTRTRQHQPPEPAVTSDDPASPSGATPIPTPRFVSEAYFMDFKFEPGNYYLAGRETARGARGAAHRVLPDASVQRRGRREDAARDEEEDRRRTTKKRQREQQSGSRTSSAR